MRILLVRLSTIGDIVHALPALASLRRRLPEAEIEWVAEKRSAEILRGNPLLDKLIEIDTRSMKGGKRIEEILLDISAQTKALRERQFDLAIDLQGLVKSAFVARASRVKRRFGFERQALREPSARFFYTDTVAIPAGEHVIRRNQRLALAAVGEELDEAEPLEFPIATGPDDVAEAQRILALTNGRIALLNPAGGWVTKLWKAENFGQLADRIWAEMGLTAVVVTAPNESALAERVRAASRSGRTVFAEPSLKGFYELARVAEVYVGGDTGPTHIAMAAGAPIVGIFGPTEWWRNGSLNPEDICVERTDIGCRINCHRRTCDNWICLEIDVDTVFEAVRRRINAAALARIEAR